MFNAAKLVHDIKYLYILTSLETETYIFYRLCISLLLMSTLTLTYATNILVKSMYSSYMTGKGAGWTEYHSLDGKIG